MGNVVHGILGDTAKKHQGQYALQKLSVPDHCFTDRTRLQGGDKQLWASGIIMIRTVKGLCLEIMRNKVEKVFLNLVKKWAKSRHEIKLAARYRMDGESRNQGQRGRSWWPLQCLGRRDDTWKVGGRWSVVTGMRGSNDSRESLRNGALGEAVTGLKDREWETLWSPSRKYWFPTTISKILSTYKHDWGEKI